jgi:hypothetical protein
MSTGCNVNKRVHARSKGQAAAAEHARSYRARRAAEAADIKTALREAAPSPTPSLKSHFVLRGKLLTLD